MPLGLLLALAGTLAGAGCASMHGAGCCSHGIQPHHRISSRWVPLGSTNIITGTTDSSLQESEI